MSKFAVMVKVTVEAKSEQEAQTFVMSYLSLSGKENLEAVVINSHQVENLDHLQTFVERNFKTRHSVRATRWNVPNENGIPGLGYECKDHPMVRSTSYSEIADILRTSGCSSEQPWWSWSVMGIIETLKGKLAVSPGDWVVTEPSGTLVVMNDYEFNYLYEATAEVF